MKILFVEDDEAIALGLQYSLEKEGYEVVWCKNKTAAIQELMQCSFHLLLLDISLPDGNGYEICTYAKGKEDVPVIFLTARDDEVNVVMGLELGGDDYIAKPFRIHELLSRIKSVLRRYHKEDQATFGMVVLQHVEVHTREGKVYKHGKEILLTALEYRLLLIFLNHVGQVLTRAQLLEGIWDVAGDYVNDNTLSVYIRRLREKLESDVQNPTLIVTVRGLGYRLERHHVEE